MKIIRMSAIWCGSCIGMKNVWNEIVKTNDLDITNYDIDFDSEEVKKYDVGNILPVAIFLDDDGNELDNICMNHPKKDVKM